MQNNYKTVTSCSPSARKVFEESNFGWQLGCHHLVLWLASKASAWNTP